MDMIINDCKIIARLKTYTVIYNNVCVPTENRNFPKIE